MRHMVCVLRGDHYSTLNLLT